MWPDNISRFRGKPNIPTCWGCRPWQVLDGERRSPRRHARHKMGMRPRTAQLRPGLAGGFPTADHRVTGLVRAQRCLHHRRLLGELSDLGAAWPGWRRIGIPDPFGPHHVNQLGQLVGHGHFRRTLTTLLRPLAAEPPVSLKRLRGSRGGSWLFSRL